MALLFIMVAYWMTRPIKDALFLSLVGKSLLPYAKILSLGVLCLLLVGYAKLVDWFKKNHLFYIVTSLLSIFLLVLAIIIAKNPDLYAQQSYLSKFVGWSAYILIDCSRVLMFSLFWSFVNSCVDVATAKKGYPLIIAGAKVGAIAGPLMTLSATKIGIDSLLFIAGVLIFIVAIIIKIFTNIYPEILVEDAANVPQKSTGAFEGLRLLMKHPYLIGIFVVSIFPDLIAEILHFSLLFLAGNSYHSPEQIVSFLGRCDILTSSITLIFALFGTSLFLRTYGIIAWLMLYPFIIAVGVIYTWIFYSLWSLVVVLAILRGLSHALDQPYKEILFIPTSKDIKFKSRSWIGAFGTRSAQGMSAGLVVFFSYMGNLLVYGSIFSLGLIGLCLPVAWYVGKTNNKFIQEDKILE